MYTHTWTNTHTHTRLDTNKHTGTHINTHTHTEECVGGGLVMLTSTDDEPCVNVFLSFGYDIMAL